MDSYSNYHCRSFDQTVECNHPLLRRYSVTHHAVFMNYLGTADELIATGVIAPANALPAKKGKKPPLDRHGSWVRRTKYRSGKLNILISCKKLEAVRDYPGMEAFQPPSWLASLLADPTSIHEVRISDHEVACYGTEGTLRDKDGQLFDDLLGGFCVCYQRRPSSLPEPVCEIDEVALRTLVMAITPSELTAGQKIAFSAKIEGFIIDAIAELRPPPPKKQRLGAAHLRLVVNNDPA